MQYSRLNLLKCSLSTAKEKKNSTVCSMEEISNQERELRQYAKRLSKNVEQLLNGLFSKLHVTIVGLQSLLSFYFNKQISNYHQYCILPSSFFASFLVSVFE